MKKIILTTLFAALMLSKVTHAQDWGGFPIKEVTDNSVLIFEGRILTDSVYLQNPPGQVATYHKVLVLKQFKGNFTSDTLMVVNFGGHMSLDGLLQGERPAYARAGDEALFLVNTYWNKSPTSPDFYFIGYGDGCGFVKVCDKKNADKLYGQIEDAVGQKHVEIHPNTCKGK